MATSIYLYPSLTDNMLREISFQGRKYTLSYLDREGDEKELDYEPAELESGINCIKTDGIWNPDKNNLFIRRSVVLKGFRNLFGPRGIACRNAKLGLSVVWTSPSSRQRGATGIMVFGVSEKNYAENKDRTFEESDIEIELRKATLRGDIKFSTVLYIAESGIPADDEMHLTNEEGFILGEIDSFTLRLDGTGSLFPVFEIYDKDQPLWNVRCDWTDPVSDLFAESVSININTAHKSYKYIDRTQKSFCPQLLVEVMSAALCCIIEKIRSEKYLDQILGDEEMEKGSVGEVIRYFENTLGWDFSTPDKLSLSVRHFFDGRIKE